MTQSMVVSEVEGAYEGSAAREMLGGVPGIMFVDHVAIAVRQGELDGQVRAYQMLGFREIHREEVLGSDQVREALLQIGDGPNLIQLLEPLNAESPVQKMMDKNGGRGGLAHIAFRAGNHLSHITFSTFSGAPSWPTKGIATAPPSCFSLSRRYSQ